MSIDVLPVPGVLGAGEDSALMGTTDRYHLVTGVREHDGRRWLGSLHQPAVAVVDL